MKRALRRQQFERVKNRVKHISHNVLNYKPSEEELSKLAQVHGVKCSCYMCGNPRKWDKNNVTMQELRVNENFD